MLNGQSKILVRGFHCPHYTSKMPRFFFRKKKTLLFGCALGIVTLTFFVISGKTGLVGLNPEEFSDDYDTNYGKLLNGRHERKVHLDGKRKSGLDQPADMVLRRVQLRPQSHNMLGFHGSDSRVKVYADYEVDQNDYLDPVVPAQENKIDDDPKQGEQKRLKIMLSSNSKDGGTSETKQNREDINDVIIDGNEDDDEPDDDDDDESYPYDYDSNNLPFKEGDFDKLNATQNTFQTDRNNSVIVAQKVNVTFWRKQDDELKLSIKDKSINLPHPRKIQAAPLDKAEKVLPHLPSKKKKVPTATLR